MQETNPFTITSKNKNKNLGINLFKEAEDLYSENYKMLMKEIEEDINRWKDILYLWIGVVIIVKMTILPKATTDSIQSLSYYQWHFSQN